MLQNFCTGQIEPGASLKTIYVKVDHNSQPMKKETPISSQNATGKELSVLFIRFYYVLVCSVYYCVVRKVTKTILSSKGNYTKSGNSLKSLKKII